MAGVLSKVELLTVGPRLVGVPKTKSAFTPLVHRPNANTSNANSIVFFIFLPFQESSLAQQGTVNISSSTPCSASLTAICLLKNRFFKLIGPELH